MSLTFGTGPFGQQRAGWSVPPLPAGGMVFVEPHPRRIVAEAGGRAVIETERAVLVHRPGAFLAYAFPAEEVGGLPSSPEPAAPGYVQVPWEAVDAWFEEGRRLVTYPSNPYHRVDCRPTRRRLRVVVDGTTLVDTDDTTVVFETSLEPRLYVDPVHVMTEHLRRTETATWCNYKGTASYWSAVVGDRVIDDAAWSYDDPLPESSPIGGFLSFDPGRLEVHADLPGEPS